MCIHVLGKVLIVVNCTTVTLPALLSSPAFHPYQPLRLGPNNGDAIKVRLVVHRVPAAVWTDSGYQNWMLAFGDDTEVCHQFDISKWAHRS